MSDYDLSSLQIIIADDYRPMRQVLRGILKEWKVPYIAEAENGERALTLLKNMTADLIITDYKMSPIDGIELTRMIRSGAKGLDPFLPVILITAYSEMDIILKARDAGINEFLAKPVSAKLVYYRIRSVIENPRPYVRVEDFFGPDRRRRPQIYKGSDRRTEQGEIVADQRGNDQGS